MKQVFKKAFEWLLGLVVFILVISGTNFLVHRGLPYLGDAFYRSSVGQKLTRQSATNATSTWQTFVCPCGDFSVSLPVIPEHKDYKLSSIPQGINHVYSTGNLQSDKPFYSIYYATIPQNIDISKNINLVLQYAVRGVASSANGKVVYEHSGNFNKYQYHEFLVKFVRSGDIIKYSYTKGRVIVVDRDIYFITANYDSINQINEVEYDWFINSFKFTSK